MTRSTESVWVDFDEKKTITDDAILFDFDGEEIWIPRSQILDEDFDDDGSKKHGSIEIPEWLAEDRGLA